MARKKSGLFDPKSYTVQYNRENVVRKMITFNRNNPDDMELLDWLTKQPESMVGYVKRIMQEDMARRRTGKCSFNKKFDDLDPDSKAVRISFPAVDGYRDEDAISECEAFGHRVRTEIVNNWSVVIDIDSRKVLQVKDTSRIQVPGCKRVL